MTIETFSQAVNTPPGTGSHYRFVNKESGTGTPITVGGPTLTVTGTSHGTANIEGNAPFQSVSTGTRTLTYTYADGTVSTVTEHVRGHILAMPDGEIKIESFECLSSP